MGDTVSLFLLELPTTRAELTFCSQPGFPRHGNNNSPPWRVQVATQSLVPQPHSSEHPYDRNSTVTMKRLLCSLRAFNAAPFWPPRNCCAAVLARRCFSSAVVVAEPQDDLVAPRSEDLHPPHSSATLRLRVPG